MGVRFVAMVVHAYFAAYPELPDLFGYPQPCMVTVCGGAAPRGAPVRLDLLATQRPRLRRLSGSAVALELVLGSWSVSFARQHHGGQSREPALPH